MTEAVDFFRRDETVVDQLVSSAVRLEDAEKTISSTSTSSSDIHDERDDYVSADLLKPYHCGVGPCHPRWLQIFANKKFFTALLCMFAFIQGSLVSGEYHQMSKQCFLLSGLVTKKNFFPNTFINSIQISVITAQHVRLTELTTVKPAIVDTLK